MFLDSNSFFDDRASNYVNFCNNSLKIIKVFVKNAVNNNNRKKEKELIMSNVNETRLYKFLTDYGNLWKEDADVNNDGTEDYLSDGTNDIKVWEIGKRYTYVISIALNKVYFAPYVSNWSDVTVTGPTI